MFELKPFTNMGNDFRNFFDDFEAKFPKNWHASIRTDIIEKEDAYLLEAELPGFDKDQIDIRLEGDYLTVKAQREETNEEKDQAGNYIHRERQYGSFSRSFRIDGVDTEKIKADFEKGLLRITLPKKKEQEGANRKIDIG